MHTLLRLPIVQRKMYTVLPMFVVGIVIMLALPKTMVEEVPYIQLVTIVHYLLIGTGLLFAGVIEIAPLIGTVNPFIRGFVVGAFINLDYMIYSWSDQATFWSIIVLTAIIAGIVDTVATLKVGSGKKLLIGITKS